MQIGCMLWESYVRVGFMVRVGYSRGRMDGIGRVMCGYEVRYGYDSVGVG